MSNPSLSTALIGRWGDFFAWTATRLPALSGTLADDVDTTPRSCPIHGGSSGEAFRFFEDASVNGGCVCNTCGPFPNGLMFLEKLAGPETAESLAREWLSFSGVAIPGELSTIALDKWASAVERDVAVSYLRKRGLPLTLATLPADIRGSLGNGKKGTRFVATLVRDRNGNPVTCQRIFLDPDLAKARGMARAKSTMKVKDDGVSLSGMYGELGVEAGQSDCLVMAEGVETALAVREFFTSLGLTTMLRVTFGGNGGTFATVPVPEGIRTLILCAESDSLAKTLVSASKLASTGVRVYVTSPPVNLANPKEDWLDVYAASGRDPAQLLFIDSLQEVTVDGAASPTAALDALAVTAEANGLEPLALSAPDDVLFRNLIEDIRRVTPQWYIQGDTEIVWEIEGRIQEVNENIAAAYFAHRFMFYRLYQGEVSPQPTPVARIRLWWQDIDTKRFLLTTLPRLKGVLRRPTLTHGQGELTLIKEPGYNKHRGFVTRLAEGELALWNRSQPSQGEFQSLRIQAASALSTLRQELIGDFPFESDADRANALAAMLTPFLTEAVEAVPLLVADAPDKGSGKTTLIRALTAPWGGSQDVQYSHDDEEMTKRLGAAFSAGNPLLLLDNLTGRIDSDKLKILITSPRTAAVRRLGSNSLIYPPSGIVLFASANNPAIQEEILRRTVFMRLNARMENPSARKNFRRLDLTGWALREGPWLRSLIYELIGAWLAAGAPVRSSPVAMAGFQHWADYCYSILSFAGAPEADSLLGNREARMESGDPELDETRVFMQVWIEEHAGAFLSAAEILEMARNHLLMGDITEQRHGIALKRIGRFLHTMQGRIFHGHELQADEKRTKVARLRYGLVPVTGAGSAPAVQQQETLI